jgi:nitrite reductase/ring-hydroxylating ferredoxin subunit
MTAPGEWRCDLEALPPGHTATFRLVCAGRTVHGFALNHEGEPHAYVNSCPHVGTPLDMFPNEFMTDDRSLLICATHGALFAPDSGICLAGPCAGDRLEPLAVRLEGRTVVVTCDGP